jgi:hypothetical protein
MKFEGKKWYNFIEILVNGIRVNFFCYFLNVYVIRCCDAMCYWTKKSAINIKNNRFYLLHRLAMFLNFILALSLLCSETFSQAISSCLRCLSHHFFSYFILFFNAIHNSVRVINELLWLFSPRKWFFYLVIHHKQTENKAIAIVWQFIPEVSEHTDRNVDWMKQILRKLGLPESVISSVTLP